MRRFNYVQLGLLGIQLVSMLIGIGVIDILQEYSKEFNFYSIAGCIPVILVGYLGELRNWK